MEIDTLESVILEVAKAIDCPSSKVADIIVESNKKKMMYHGIKRASKIVKIQEQGILPLTPEGRCSYWAAGLSLFYSMDDSPFFCYSGSYEKEGVCELNLAVTSLDELRKKSIEVDYEDDSKIRISQVVPYDAIALLDIKLKHPVNGDARKYRQFAEQMLLNAIHAQLFDCFTPGKTKEYEGEL